MITKNSRINFTTTRFAQILLALFFLCLPRNTAAQNESISSAGRPNLAPSNINLGTYSALAGDQITIAWTVTNSGSATCPASFTGLHIGQSPTIRPVNDDLNLLLVTPEISAHSSIRQTNTVTLPLNLTLGNVYIWVVVDDVQTSTLNQTTRTDDAAHSSALAIVTVRRQPNLLPQNVTIAPTTARPGDQVALAWTLANSGTVTAPTSLTGFHIGTSSTTLPASDPLNLAFETPEIPTGGSIRFTNLVTIPTNTALGTYYLWVVADDVTDSTLNQSTRADDVARSPALSLVSTLPHPNLVPQNITLSTYMARPGDPITVICTVTNSGDAPAAASTTGLHLGTSATVRPTTSALNLSIPTPAINSGTSVRLTNTITIPPGTTLGTYYLWVVVDDVTTSTLDQSSRADDAAASSTISIVATIPQPNLIVTNITLNTQFARPGDPVTISWSVANIGTSNSPASQTGFHLGTSATVRPVTSTLNLLIPTPALPINVGVRQTNTLTIPANAPLGTSYLWVIADDVPNSTLGQSSKADDATASPALNIVATIPQPNLLPANVQLSSYSVKPGTQITVSWNMKNNGNTTCPPSITGLHIGPSPNTKPVNDPLNLAIQTPSINANSFIPQTAVVTIPATLTGGTFYIWVVADDVPNSTLNQSNRADDAALSSALQTSSVTLISPAVGATVDAPPAFEWDPQSIPNGTVYLATSPIPVFGVDKLAIFEVPAGTNKFRPLPTNWVTAVQTLGVAPNYYWTMGAPNLATPQIYASWRPFKTIPLPISRSVTAVAGQLQFQIVAPNHSQVTVEATTSLTNAWSAVKTIPNTTGVTTFSDPIPGTTRYRFYRAKP